MTKTHKFPPQGTGTTGYRTILAYYGEGHSTRVNYYSNPKVDYLGAACGNATYADNARLLTERRLELAAIGDESTCLGQSSSEYLMQDEIS